MPWVVDDTVVVTGEGKDQWRGLVPGAVGTAQAIALSVETSADLADTINAGGFVALAYVDGETTLTLRSYLIPFLPPRNISNRYLLNVEPQTIPSHVPVQLPILIVSIPRWFPETTLKYWVFRV